MVRFPSSCCLPEILSSNTKTDRGAARIFYKIGGVPVTTVLVLMAVVKLGISLLLLTALFTKDSLPLFETTEPLAKIHWLVSAIQNIHAPFVVGTVFLLLNGSLLGGVFLLGVMVITGVLIKRFGRLSRCNCYGSLARRTQGEHWLTVALGIMAVAALALRGAFGANVEMLDEGRVLFPLALLLAAIASHVIKRRDEDTAILRASSDTGPAQNKESFEAVCAVGYDISGAPVLLSEIAETCPMIVFIALFSECNVCAALKPILFPIVRLFEDSLRCVFLIDEWHNYDMKDENYLILRRDPDFIARFAAEKFPFAAIINSQSLSIIGPINYGDAIGSLIFRALLVALRTRTRMVVDQLL